MIASAMLYRSIGQMSPGYSIPGIVVAIAALVDVMVCTTLIIVSGRLMGCL